MNRTKRFNPALAQFTGKKVVNILYVDDNPADQCLVSELFKSRKYKFNIRGVSDGIQALAFLQKETPFHSAFTPDLILLDYNLPVKSGEEILKEIKNDPRFKEIPVIIFSSSAVDADVRCCLKNKAHLYLTKPIDLSGFSFIVSQVEKICKKVLNESNDSSSRTLGAPLNSGPSPTRN